MLTEAELNALGRDVTHVYADGTQARTIRVDLVDTENYWSDAGVKDITVQNVAPTAMLVGSGTVNEGSTGTVVFLNQNDAAAPTAQPATSTATTSTATASGIPP